MKHNKRQIFNCHHIRDTPNENSKHILLMKKSFKSSSWPVKDVKKNFGRILYQAEINNAIPMSFYVSTRMHSSRMCTGHLLTVSQSLLLGGGSTPRGLSCPDGVAGPGGSGQGVGGWGWSGPGGLLVPGGWWWWYPSMH